MHVEMYILNRDCVPMLMTRRKTWSFPIVASSSRSFIMENSRSIWWDNRRTLHRDPFQIRRIPSHFQYQTQILPQSDTRRPIRLCFVDSADKWFWSRLFREKIVSIYDFFRGSGDCRCSEHYGASSMLKRVFSSSWWYLPSFLPSSPSPSYTLSPSPLIPFMMTSSFGCKLKLCKHVHNPLLQ